MADSSQVITLQSWGQKFILETGSTLVGQTALDIIFQNQAGVTQTESATTDSEAGGEVHIDIPQDFWTDYGTAGTWKAIAKVTRATGILYTRPVTLYIRDQWDD